MNVMEKLAGKTIIHKYADLKRENLYSNSLINEDIRNTIVSYIDDTENLFNNNFLTLDEAILKIAMSADNALKEAQA